MLKQVMIVLYLSTLMGCGFGAANPNAPVYATYDPSLPNPIPASCPQPPYLAASALSDAMHAATPYWFGSPSLAAGHVGGAAWRSGDNAVVWMWASEQPRVEVNLLEGSSSPAGVKFLPGEAPIRASVITIPKVGCWEIIATTGANTLHFLFYVFPARFVP